MPTLQSHKLLSFDVYGTLIDWETGILTALQPLLKSNNATNMPRHTLLTAYHALEAAQQTQTPSLPYSQLLSTVHPQLAAHFDWTAPTAAESQQFGESIGSWPAFPDTVAALHRLGQHFKLVVLSNVDRASFARSLAGPLSGVVFDTVITAQDVGSYKPDRRNFEYMLEVVGREFGVGREGVLQTAQSQFHDHHAAREVGLRSVWIVRPGGVMGNLEGEVWDWRFDTLGEMADAVEAEGR